MQLVIVRLLAGLLTLLSLAGVPIIIDEVQLGEIADALVLTGGFLGSLYAAIRMAWRGRLRPTPPGEVVPPEELAALRAKARVYDRTHGLRTEPPDVPADKPPVLHPHWPAVLLLALLPLLGACAGPDRDEARVPWAQLGALAGLLLLAGCLGYRETHMTGPRGESVHMTSWGVLEVVEQSYRCTLARPDGTAVAVDLAAGARTDTEALQVVGGLARDMLGMLRARDPDAPAGEGARVAEGQPEVVCTPWAAGGTP